MRVFVHCEVSRRISSNSSAANIASTSHRLYKTFRNKKYIYFLMEPCLGGDVWTQLQQHKHFSEPIAQFVTGCVIEALEYLHSRNIIYRDLKPENLMVDGQGFVKMVCIPAGNPSLV